MDNRTCAADGCPKPSLSRGLCSTHYRIDRLASSGKACSVEGCKRPWAARDWCLMHYQRQKKHGDVNYVEIRRRNICVVVGCELNVTGRGWCSKHYTRWKRYGDPLFRVKGEVRDGRRICPGCGSDKLLAEYSGATGRCKACIAAERKVARLAQVSVPLPAIHCITCGDVFVPRTSKVYCCSVECSSERNRVWNSYRGRVDRNLTYQRAWQKENPGGHRAAQARRRAQKMTSRVGVFGKAEIAARMSFFGNRCWMCRGPFEAIDHVKPLSKGGPHLLANLRPACNRCNSSKSNRWEGVSALNALTS